MESTCQCLANVRQILRYRMSLFLLWSMVFSRFPPKTIAFGNLYRSTNPNNICLCIVRPPNRDFLGMCSECETAWWSSFRNNARISSYADHKYPICHWICEYHRRVSTCSGLALPFCHICSQKREPPKRNVKIEMLVNERSSNSNIEFSLAGSVYWKCFDWRLLNSSSLISGPGQIIDNEQRTTIHSCMHIFNFVMFYSRRYEWRSSDELQDE